MISIKNLTKKFGKFTAVDDISLDIEEGEVFSLLGLNGAGKSTTILMICTLLEKTSGNVKICGLDLDKEAAKIKSIINLSPQETAVANNLTVLENLKLIATLYGTENALTEAEKMTKVFGLETKANSRAKTLSGGQKRKLSIAMALITNPKILVLDEPTLGLDIKSRRALWEIINEQKQGRIVILTTHYLEEAEALSDRIAIMANGKIAALGTTKEIVAKSGKDNFEDAFLFFAGGDNE